VHRTRNEIRGLAARSHLGRDLQLAAASVFAPRVV
jgi:hypothetical protein